jgi:short-subunit dehydrogenase involved in D-alanine esterification of teichoic acids
MFNLKTLKLAQEDWLAKNLLIAGAGAGFARCTGQKYGSQDRTVHLIARSRSRLEDLAASLADESVGVHEDVGDVTQHAWLSGLVSVIDDVHPLDACVLQPQGDKQVVDIQGATVGNVRSHLEMLVLRAVALRQTVVPKMVERARGCLVFVGGGSARLALTVFGNLGIAMPGLRNYTLTLNAVLALNGGHSAFYTAAGINRRGVEPGRLDLRQLGERIYALFRDRDARDVLMTPDGDVVPKGER